MHFLYKFAQEIRESRVEKRRRRQAEINDLNQQLVRGNEIQQTKAFFLFQI